MRSVLSGRVAACAKLSAVALTLAVLAAAPMVSGAVAEEDATARSFASAARPYAGGHMRVGRTTTESFDDGESVAPSRKRRSSSRRARQVASYDYAEEDIGEPVVRGRARNARQSNRRRSRGVEVASLGDSYVPSRRPAPSLSGGGGIRWVASSGCLTGSLRSVISEVAQRFGSVTVNSTCRSRGHNARVGGARHSHHLTGNAADFRVHGNVGAVYSFLRSHGSVGGLKHYGGGLFHIDTGARRSW